MISAVVLTKNEESSIKDCLRSLSWCDEIIVIDDYSSDLTLKRVKEIKNNRIKICKRKLSGDFAAQRNFGLLKCKGEWVLFLDADERISLFLKKEIIGQIKKTDNDGFYLKRRDYFLGKELKYGETANNKFLRLGRKGKGKWYRKVHEEWRVNGVIGELNNPIIHKQNPSLSEFISKLNKYSEIHSEENLNEGKRSTVFKVIFYPIFKFGVNYFWKLGVLDGTRGFIIAAAMSFHSFLSWSKLWFHF